MFGVGSERSGDRRMSSLYLQAVVCLLVWERTLSNIPPFTAISESISGTGLSERQSLLALHTLQQSRGRNVSFTTHETQVTLGAALPSPQESYSWPNKSNGSLRHVTCLERNSHHSLLHMNPKHQLVIIVLPLVSYNWYSAVKENEVEKGKDWRGLCYAMWRSLWGLFYDVVSTFRLYSFQQQDNWWIIRVNWRWFGRKWS
jgi:hypothetical protein